MPRPVIYVRLSREDLQGAEATAEKFLLRVANCRQLATTHGLSVAEEHIYIERESGGKLSNRPLLLKILDDCERGEISHLITPAYDRLSRGDARDNADIEDALLSGCVTLITNDGATRYDDSYEDKYAPLQGLKAIFARMERRATINRMKAANAQRTAQGVKSQGVARYGYKWVKPVYDGKRLAERGRYEIIPHEYEIVQEIFQRVRNEGIRTIAADLNARGVPTPGVSKWASYTSSNWLHGTLRHIVINPFYAGYPAHTHTVNRKGDTVRLPPEQWILSDSEQSYPHPVTLAEQEEIRAVLRLRKVGGIRRANSPAYLTGLLRCHKGYSMGLSGASYRCSCSDSNTHDLRSLSGKVAHALAQELAQEALFSIPRNAVSDTSAPSIQPPDASPLLRELNAKRREIAQFQSLRDTLQRVQGEEGYNQSLSRLEAEREGIERRIAEAGTVALEQIPADMGAMLDAMTEVGFKAFWEAFEVPHKSEIMRLLFRSLTIQPEQPRHHARRVTVEPQAWLSPYFPPQEKAIPRL